MRPSATDGAPNNSPETSLWSRSSMQEGDCADDSESQYENRNKLDSSSRRGRMYK